MFAKPEDAKKNDIATENVSQLSNKNVATKSTAVAKNTTDNIQDPAPLIKSHQILSEQTPTEAITPDDKRSPGCTKKESTHVNKDTEVGGSNIENTPPSKEHNQVSSFIILRYGCSTRVHAKLQKRLNL